MGNGDSGQTNVKNVNRSVKINKLESVVQIKHAIYAMIHSILYQRNRNLPWVFRLWSVFVGVPIGEVASWVLSCQTKGKTFVFLTSIIFLKPTKVTLCICIWSYRCWRSLSISVVMVQTISSQNLGGTPPSSNKHQVRHWYFSIKHSAHCACSVTWIFMLFADGRFPPQFIVVHLIPFMALRYTRKCGTQHRWDTG